jgi:hypothetical protein
LNNEDQKLEERKNLDDKFEESMHKQYTDIEEEYHGAYPNRPMPWTMGFLTGVFSRYGRGMLLWALAGAVVAVVLWLAYTIYYHNNLR